MQLIEIKNLDAVTGNLFITWALTRKCKMNCSYCYVKDKDNYSSLVSNDDIGSCGSILHYITYALTQNTSSKKSLFLFGGEPTQHPYWKKIVSTINRIPNVTISMQTNLTAPIGDYLDFLKDTGNELEVSYHAGFDFYVFIDKVSLLPKDRVTIYIMFDPSISQKCKDMLVTLRDLGYTVYLTPIDGIKLSEDDARYLKSQYFLHDTKLGKCKLTYDNEYSVILDVPQIQLVRPEGFKGFRCSAGLTHLFIECNGDIYPCEPYANNLSEQGKLGNVRDNYHYYDFVPECKVDKGCCEYMAYKRLV